MNTCHSLERAIERLGLNENEAIRFTKMALARGKESKDMPKNEKQYMESKQVEIGIRTVYYNGIMLVFNSWDECITMYEAPSWFGRKKHYDGKQEIRDAKKYIRYSREAI